VKILTDYDEVSQQLTLLIEEYKDSQKKIEAYHNKLQIALSSSLRLLNDSEKKTLDRLKGKPSDLSNYLFSIISELKYVTNEHFLSLKQHTDNISQILLNANRKH
jgi:hypothetical protein